MSTLLLDGLFVRVMSPYEVYLEREEEETQAAFLAANPGLGAYPEDGEGERAMRSVSVCSLCDPCDRAECPSCLATLGFPFFRHSLFGIPRLPAAEATPVSRWPLFPENSRVVCLVGRSGRWGRRR